MDIKETSPFIYDVAVHFAQRLETEYNIIIPENETSYLAIHIGFILSKEISTQSRISIALYATNYHQIGQLIYEKLVADYQDLAVVYFYCADTENIPAINFDLIISTIDISVMNTSFVKITPFYNVVDRSAVDIKVNQIIKGKDEKRNLEYLLSCFSEDLFFITSELNSKDEAISFLGNKLQSKGIVDDEFINLVHERESLSSTCFLKSFSLPHSILMNARKTTFSVLINPSGINWDNNFIKICIMITIKKEDQKMFRNAYNGLAQILTDEKKRIGLINSTSYDEFISIIKKNVEY